MAAPQERPGGPQTLAPRPKPVPVPTSSGQLPPPASEPPTRRWLPWALVGAGVVVLLVVLAAIAVATDRDRPSGGVTASPATTAADPPPASEPPPPTDPPPATTLPSTTVEAAPPPATTLPSTTIETEPTPETTTPPPDDSRLPPTTVDVVPAPTDPGTPGDPGDLDDVGPCVFVDRDTIVLDVTNTSSVQSSYVIDVSFLDDAGERVGDEPFFVDHLRPGERTVEESFVFDSSGGVGCEITEVARFATESPDDVSEVACEVVGVDFVGDVAAAFTASNGSSVPSDYSITAALVRDGVRAGTAWAFIDGVGAGDTVPGDGFSVVPGPADGVECDVVHVIRTPSS